MKATFGRLLERWMGDRGYEAVAPLLGASVGAVHAWRHGESLPANSRVHILAAAMGVPEPKLRKVIARDRARREHAADGAPASNGATETTPAAPVTP